MQSKHVIARTRRVSAALGLWLLAMRALVSAAHAQDFVGIQGRWELESYVHAEEPTPGVGSIQLGWWSAMWQMEPAGKDLVRIKNR